MLVAMLLDRPLTEAQIWIRNPDAFVSEIVKTMSDKKSHPVIVQMLKADVRDDLPTTEFDPPTATSSSHHPIRFTQNPLQPREP